jgi:hypothetical protein
VRERIEYRLEYGSAAVFTLYSYSNFRVSFRVYHYGQSKTPANLVLFRSILELQLHIHPSIIILFLISYCCCYYSFPLEKATTTTNTNACLLVRHHLGSRLASIHVHAWTHATRRLEHIISGSSSPAAAAAPAPAPRRWPAAAAASSPLPSCCQSQPTALPPLHQPKPHLRKPRQRISTTLHYGCCHIVILSPVMLP